MGTWVFRKVEKNQSDERAADDPDTDYMYEIMSATGAGSCLTSGTRRKDYEPLLAFWGLVYPEELTGRVFETPDENPRWDVGYAFQLLLLSVRHGGSYHAPSHETVRARAISAFGEGRLPDFSDMDSVTRSEAIDGGWGGAWHRPHQPYHPNPEWLSAINGELTRASNSQVRIEEATDEERRAFGFDCNCVSHAYLFLVTGDQRKRFIYHGGGSFMEIDRQEVEGAV